MASSQRVALVQRLRSYIRSIQCHVRAAMTDSNVRLPSSQTGDGGEDAATASLFVQRFYQLSAERRVADIHAVRQREYL